MVERNNLVAVAALVVRAVVEASLRSVHSTLNTLYMTYKAANSC